MAREATAIQSLVEPLQDHDQIVVWSDEQLVRQFLSRTDESAEAAFAALIERHGSIVYRVCRDILHGRDEAQDAAQAVFLVLARKARSIRKPESIGPWLHGVALRVARRARTGAARRKAAERINAEVMRQRQTTESRPAPMDYTELHEEIDRLPEKYRQPIVLCYLQGRTQLQAAETLSWPLGTVQIRLHRGRERLRSRLQRRSAGLIGLITSDLAAPSFAKATMPGPEWTETTARAAVRFAAGKGTAGLVTPVVTALAKRVLMAMFSHTLGLVAVTAFAMLSLAWVILSSIGPSSGFVRAAGSNHASTLITIDEVQSKKRPIASIPDASARIVVEKNRTVDRKPQTQEKSTRLATLVSQPADPPAEVVVAPRPPSLTSGSLSLNLTGRRPERPPAIGRELFERVWVKDDPRGHGGDGLGPVFNGQSCVECHNQGGTGGAGGLARNVEIATPTDNGAEGMGFSYAFSMDFGAGRFEYRLGGYPNGSPSRAPRVDPRILAAIHPGFRSGPSLVLHRYGTDPGYNAWRASVPGQHGSILVQVSERNPPALFGAGLIDAIPDAVLEATAKRKPAAVKGRVSRLKDGRIGRFGWKAQTPTLKEFVLSAAAGEMGLEVPGHQQAADPRLPGVAASAIDMDDAECDLLVEFVRSLRVPVAVGSPDKNDLARLKTGEETFKSIGCAVCHVPKLGDVAGIYSDLLLHDMGPRLADTDAYTVFVSDRPRVEDALSDLPRAGSGTASTREWRTPPLWGLRDSGPYLHDGRAVSIDQAVALHAGQGAASARRFAELSTRRKQNLEAFLLSLVAPSGN